MAKTKVFIDGENFTYKVETILANSGMDKKKINIAHIKLYALLQTVLLPIKFDEVVFYGAKLHFHEETAEKSRLLISRQRALKANLENQNIKVILAGNVRAQEVTSGKFVFREKGVDVKMAVDLVSEACDHHIKRAIVCSSDSDLQPAIAELKGRKVEVIYLGFELNPNKGLTITADRTILFRNAEICSAF